MSNLKKTLITAVVIGLFATVAFATLGPDVDPDIMEGDIVSDLDPMTGVPISGSWYFKLDVGKPGTAYVYTGGDGAFVNIVADGQSLNFFRSGSIVPYTYTSAQRAFPLQSPTGVPFDGSAYFEFTAVDSDRITGVVHHSTDNGGMTTKSFYMELLEEELPDMAWFELNSGSWNISYEDVNSDCEDGAISFPDLPSNFDLDYVVDMDTGEFGDEIHLDFGGEDIYLESDGESNAYFQEEGSVDAGVPMDGDGDVMLDYENDSFDAEVNVFGADEGLIEGYIEITGSNGCGYTVGFSASS